MRAKEKKSAGYNSLLRENLALARLLAREGKSLAILLEERLVSKKTLLANEEALGIFLDDMFINKPREVLPAAYVYFDLDNFKQINDTYGHDTGDKILLHVGQHFSRTMRVDDQIFHLHGDEFVAVLIGVNEVQAEAVLARLTDIPHFILAENMVIKPSITFGYTMIYDQEKSWRLHRIAADNVMLANKRKKGGTRAAS